MVLQHSSVGKSLHWHVKTILFKVGIFPPSYAVKLILIIAWIPTFNTNFVWIFCYSIQLYMSDCSIRVTAVLEYLKSASV